mgnify:CR=1 FL=1
MKDAKDLVAGVVGLGSIGGGVATSLANSGRKTVVYNRTAGKYKNHPGCPPEEESLKALAEQYGLLGRLSLKMSKAYFTDVIYPVFGNEVEKYVILLPESGGADAARAAVSAFDERADTLASVKKVIEPWISSATPETVSLIREAGYSVSLASAQHEGPDGSVRIHMEADDYKYWTGLGVTEMTDARNPSFGLSWN